MIAGIASWSSAREIFSKGVGREYRIRVHGDSTVDRVADP